jgi:hypothetical protein
MSGVSRNEDVDAPLPTADPVGSFPDCCTAGVNAHSCMHSKRSSSAAHADSPVGGWVGVSHQAPVQRPHSA